VRASIRREADHPDDRGDETGALQRQWVLCSPMGIFHRPHVGIVIEADDRWSYLAWSGGQLVAQRGLDKQGSVTYIDNSALNGPSSIQVGIDSDLGGGIGGFPAISHDPMFMVFNNNGVHTYTYAAVPGTEIAGSGGAGGAAGGPGTGGQVGGGSGGMTGSGGGPGDQGTGGRGAGTGGQGGASPRPGVCYYAGAPYPVHTNFPGVGSDWCNTCRCTDAGSSCTLIGCSAWPGGPGVCIADGDYRYGDVGGLVAYRDEASLLRPTTTGPTSYRYARRAGDGTEPLASCSPALPACNAEGLVDLADVLRGLGHADVQRALAEPSPPLFGRDTRPVDGQLFQLLRGDGRGFLVGSPCAAADSSCAAIPIGVTDLVSMLRALDAQQLMDTTCEPLHR
jgi:hypothetical protein